MKRTIIEWILITIVFSCVRSLLPAITIGSSRTLVMSSLLLTLLDSTARPLLKAFEISYSYILLCAITYVFNALIIFLLLTLVKDSSIANIGYAFIASLFITLTERLLDLAMPNEWK